MAIETLRDAKETDGFKIVIMDELREKFPEKFEEDGKMKKEFFEKEIRGNKFIVVNLKDSTITFTLQNGPIKENGVNGCQVDTLVSVAAGIIDKLNKKFRCSYNERAVECLSVAYNLLKDRKKDREKRNVEGLNKA